ncbi:hypothetical protein CEXT_802961 [Caerostris extrusa]|uniref:Uncharacterized protein n=1 Tax=Caerostris extrusa TaxID=172846 RepID=A0AAV4MAT9_CAEEX|nr:hypothetical protein CEXT_802961 [Caerostris extrusa]
MREKLEKKKAEVHLLLNSSVPELLGRHPDSQCIKTEIPKYDGKLIDHEDVKEENVKRVGTESRKKKKEKNGRETTEKKAEVHLLLNSSVPELLGRHPESQCIKTEVK